MRTRLDAVALPTGRTGRLTALGLGILALVMVWLGLVAPLIALYTDRAVRLRDERALLVRMNALDARIPMLRARLAAVGADAPGRDSALPGTRDASAAAALQQMIMAMATAHALTLASVTVLPAEAAGESRRIGVRLAFSARWADLVAFLRSVETARPALIADDLSVQAQGSGDVLDIGLTVHGFRTAGPPHDTTSMTDTTLAGTQE